MQNRPRHRTAKHPRRADRASDGRYWMFGLHAVRAALENPNRAKHRLILSRNAANQLEAAIASAGIDPEISDVRRFAAPLDPQSVHQGAALETEALDWGPVEACCPAEPDSVALLLDRVTDPHNVGAILRSAEVFGAAAVIAPHRHSAPETGALAKAASGALERQPYLQVRNLSETMTGLQKRGYVLIGLAGEAEIELPRALEIARGSPVGLVLGAEGPGMREKTRETCDVLARIGSGGDFASLNVSNAAAVSLFAATQQARLQH